MTNEPSATSSTPASADATPAAFRDSSDAASADESLADPSRSPVADEGNGEGDDAQDSAARTATLEELAAELAQEPLEVDDGESAAVEVVRPAAVVKARRPGVRLSALNGGSSIAAYGVADKVAGRAALGLLRSPAFSQRDLLPGVMRALEMQRLTTDVQALAGLRSAESVAAKLTQNYTGLTARTALDAIGTRSALLEVIGGLDAHAWQSRNLGVLADAMAKFDVNASVLGSLKASAGIGERLSLLAAGTQPSLIAGLLAAGNQPSLIAGLGQEWNEKLAAGVERREWLLMTATKAAPERRLLSARPLTAYNRLLGGLPLEESGEADLPKMLAVERTHGSAVDALVAADALLSPLADDDLGEVIEVVEDEVVAPWRLARGDVGDRLFAALGAIDPKLAEMYEGAWTAFEGRGAGYLEAACHLANEVMARSLRQLAPDEEVRAWARQMGMRDTDICSPNGNVTRGARLRYIQRGAGVSRDERKLLVSEADAVSRAIELLTNRLNAGKHASAGDHQTLEANLITFEGVMLRVVYGAGLNAR